MEIFFPGFSKFDPPAKTRAKLPRKSSSLNIDLEMESPALATIKSKLVLQPPDFKILKSRGNPHPLAKVPPIPKL